MNHVRLFQLARESLSEGQHDTPPKGYPKDRKEYAVPEFWEFPVDTPKRVRAALTYFSKHKWRSDEEKKKAAKIILTAAKRFGIKTATDTDVYKAAH